MDSSCFRPGGLSLTDRALSHICPPEGAKVLDVGCGRGETAHHLTHTYGCAACGVDRDAQTVSDASGAHPGIEFRCAPAEHLPYPEEFFDVVLFECSLSCTEDPVKALREARRVLKLGGSLVMSDVYALGAPVDAAGFLGRLESKDTVLRRLKDVGFSLELFEDHLTHLREMTAQLIWELGSNAFYESAGADREALKAASCSYYLAVARRAPD